MGALIGSIIGGVLAYAIASDRNHEMAEQQDTHFICAAMISAADRLIAAGRLPSGAINTDKALLAAMTHLNAWAIRKNINEADAFDAVKKERDRLLAELPPQEIASRAKRCVEGAS